MRITLEVPEDRADFVLELLHSLPFVTLLGRAAKRAVANETKQQLASSTNAAHLRPTQEGD